jgi:hypothetical protein
MKILQLERRKGKTTALIYTSATTGYPIIVLTEVEAEMVQNMANSLGIDIPHPITLKTYMTHGGYYNGNNGILIDNLDIMLPQILNDYFKTNVVGATMNKE